MKKCGLLLAFLLYAAAGMAQGAADSLPYLKDPVLPAFNVELLDSSVFSTANIPAGKPTILMFFSPDCEHCRDLTQTLTTKMDSLSGAQFYLLTWMPMGLTKVFYRVLNLKDYPNVTVGRDFTYFFPSFFKVNKVPYLALYDRKKRFVHLYDGHVKMEELIRAVNSL